MAATSARPPAIFLFFFVVVIAGASYAQERYGGIAGVITDQSGGVLAGVTVTLTDQSSGRIITTVSDGEGVYRALELGPGRYHVRFSVSGFTPLEYPAVVILLGRTVDLDATLAIAGFIDAVQVATDPAPVVDMRTAITAHNVAAEEFRKPGRSCRWRRPRRR